ncbi:MAG: restriction endonuclease subunit S [Clostridia bacterium]|nr:restriction endonuclease subunit S [Clostridia bacterium]
MKNGGIEWIGNIPNNWDVSKVKHCFYISKQKAGDKNPTILKLARSAVQIRDISTNEGQLAESYENYNPVKVGDLLLNPMDLYSGANCNVSEIEGVISPAYQNLRKKVELNPKYFDYFFKIQYWTMAMFAHGRGISFDNRWTINTETILNYYIPFPSFEVQNSIVNVLTEKLSQVDELIANQEKQIEKLKEYKQSVITEAVTKGLDKSAPLKDSGIEWIGEIPESWNVFQLKNISTIKTGHTPSTAHIENFNGNVNWYTPSDFVNETIENSSRKISEYALQNEGITLFPVNTTLLVGIGGTAGKVCRILVEGYSNQQITALMVNDKVDPVYLFYELTASRRYLKDNAMYTTLPIINNSYLGFLKFVIPNIETQKQIVDYLDEKCGKIDRLIAIKQEKIEKLQEYKKSLIYEYVTGKKEVV